MYDPSTLDLIWWITAVELPVMAGLFWLGWRTRRDLETALDDARHEADAGIAYVREKLSAFKLEVAKSYASISYLKEVERRLTHHLLRIEDKLDRTSTSVRGDGQ